MAERSVLSPSSSRASRPVSTLVRSSQVSRQPLRLRSAFPAIIVAQLRRWDTMAETFLQCVAIRAAHAPHLPSQWPPPSPAAHSRAIDLLLIGHQLSLTKFESPSAQRLFRTLWRDLVIPAALRTPERIEAPPGYDWEFGATALIHGLQSAAAAGFNGQYGRISSRHPSAEGRFELIADGPDGVGTVKLKPANLAAPADIASVLQTARMLPPVVHVGPRPEAAFLATAAERAKIGAIRCEPCDPPPAAAPAA